MFDAGFDYFKLQNTTMNLYTFLAVILLFGNEIHGSGKTTYCNICTGTMSYTKNL